MKDRISLYFHIPFCSKKCPYCHFFVLPDKQELKEELALSIELEIELYRPFFQDKEIVSVYFGGGTPSLFGAKALGKILEQLPLLENTEITLEINPENSPLAFLQELKAIGFNRLSFGVQSLDDSTLYTLGRGHSASKAIEALFAAEKAGFENVTIDLMYEIPGQTYASFESSLKKLKSLPIHHLSLYNLTFEPGTVFYKRQKELKQKLPSAEDALLMLESAVETLESIGLNRYEISAFAKKGFESKHNSGYWTARPFLGFGPSAFSYWDKSRYRNVAHLGKYTAALKKGEYPVDFKETIPYPENVKELLMVELRLIKGVDLELFQKRHAALPSETFRSIEKLQEEDLLIQKGTVLSLTKKGRLFYDTVGVELV